MVLRPIVNGGGIVGRLSIQGLNMRIVKDLRLLVERFEVQLFEILAFCGPTRLTRATVVVDLAALGLLAPFIVGQFLSTVGSITVWV
jgi:hypothetical protein